MELETARKIAERVLADLSPFIQRGEIKGSIARNKPDVKDIELVVIPKTEQACDLFGSQFSIINLFENEIGNILELNYGRFIKNGPRYKQIALFEGINIDLFIVIPPAQWGLIATLRTGPSILSHQFVTPRRFMTKPVDGVRYPGLLPSFAEVHDGAIWNCHNIVLMPEEHDFFEFVGLDWIEPASRQPLLNPKFKVAV